MPSMFFTFINSNSVHDVSLRASGEKITDHILDDSTTELFSSTEQMIYTNTGMLDWYRFNPSLNFNLKNLSIFYLLVRKYQTK